jgi:hypothetical protein
LPHPDVQQAIKERPRREDDARSGEEDIARYNPFDAGVAGGYGRNGRLAEVEVGRALEQPPRAAPVVVAVALQAGAADRRPLGAVQDPALDRRGVRQQADRAAEGVDLLDEGALADAADGGVAGHQADGVEAAGEHQRPATYRGRGSRGLYAGVAAADHYDVVRLGVSPHTLFCGPDIPVCGATA